MGRAVEGPSACAGEDTKLGAEGASHKRVAEVMEALESRYAVAAGAYGSRFVVGSSRRCERQWLSLRDCQRETSYGGGIRKLAVG